MPFGLCNAGATFERLMEKVLSNLSWNMCMVYLDDIIILSKTFEEHIENLRQVFERLKSANLKMNLKKCCILQKQVSFLGHVVSENGISTDPSKLESIKNWPVPKLLKISEVSYGYVHTIESLSQNLQILQDLSINSQSLKQNFSGIVTANKPLIN